LHIFKKNGTSTLGCPGKFAELLNLKPIKLQYIPLVGMMKAAYGLLLSAIKTQPRENTQLHSNEEEQIQLARSQPEIR
jgi:hypothetical protein